MLVFLFIWALIATIVASIQLLGNLASEYGNVVIREGEDGQTVYSLEVSGDIDEIKNLKYITFRVVSQGDAESQ